MTKPTLDTDRRGVSEVIGSILVFGLVIMLVSLLQVQAIPNANEEVEFEHSQQVRGDFSDLQVAIDKTLDSGRSQSASVRMGVDYPSRLLFYNPPSKSGTLRTTEKRTMTISNVSSDSDAGTFFSKKNNSHVVEYETRSLTYSIGYHELANSPNDVREPAVSYRYENDVPLISETNLVEGTEINLVAIGGELDAGGVTSQKIEAKPLSAPAKTYPVEDTGDNITIEVPTRLSESQWRDLLAGEPNVVSVEVTPPNPQPGTVGTLKVELKAGVQYTLRTSKVGFGTGGDPKPRYMVPVSTEPGEATVEVRDAFNNPVSGVTLEVEFQPGGNNTTVTTGPDGRASVTSSGGASSAVFSKDFPVTNSSDLEEVEVFFRTGVVVTDVVGYNGDSKFDVKVLNGGSERTIQSIQVHHLTEYDAGLDLEGPASQLTGAVVNDGPDELTGLEVNGSSASFTTKENGPIQPMNSSIQLPSGSQTLTFKTSAVYAFRENNDGLAARVTIFFSDGGKKTFDIVIHAGDDTP